MSKMCLAHLGLFLLALSLLSLQVVQAQNITAAPTMTPTMNYTSMSSNTTGDKSGCGRTDVFTMLLPLALATHLLHGWS